jgi:DNA-binding response OmpR family regulator
MEPVNYQAAFRSTSPSSSIHDSHTYIFLGPDLWFDPATATLLRQGESILLTAREAAVLRILLKPPYSWHTAYSLAQKLKKLFALPVEAHSIEQTVHGLRRKLGETGKHPHILLSHYGHGYRISPQMIASHKEENTPPTQ